MRYRAEKYSLTYAHSNSEDQDVDYNYRSCRACRGRFHAGDLRLCARVQSFKRDGFDELWYHSKCFFQTQRPSSIEQIENYENLPLVDQETIRTNIEIRQIPLIPDDDDSKPSTSNANPFLKRPAEPKAKAAKIVLADFEIEYSVSSRAECCGCRNKIMKGLVRVSKNMFFTDIGMRFGGQKFQHHLECFANMCGDEYGFYLSADQIPKFKNLTKKDQEIAMELLPGGEVSAEKRMRLEAGPSDYDPKLEELIKSQTTKFQLIREELKTFCNAKMLGQFLKLNESKVVSGYENILDRCADFIAFGALMKCASCKNGDFQFSKHGYQCDGRLNEWADCDKFETDPRRKTPIFSKSMNTIRENLLSKGVKIGVEYRAVRPKQTKVYDPKREVKVIRKREPLYNMHIIAIGKFSIDRKKLKQRIESMGGKLVGKLQEKIAFIISNENEVEKMNKRMQQVKDFKIQVLNEDFLDEIGGHGPEEVMEMIKTNDISDWECSEPLSRIPQEDASEYQEFFTRGTKKVENVTIKDGLAIDPASGLSDEAHVYKREGILYTSVLAMVDIQKNKNSFFKIQVLQSDDLRHFWVFTSWGRIATRIGDKKTEQFMTAEQAVTEFDRLYRDKTGNRFDPNVEFVKKPGKYYPIDVDYEDDTNLMNLNTHSEVESKLSKPVQDLMKMIFDIENMRQTMMEFELDLRRMPLGRLSKKQLNEAHKTLSDLNDLIVNAADTSLFIGLSNKFYTLVPHSSGTKSPPVIDTLEMIKEKREMIESLLQIEIAYSLLQGEVDENANPIDARYEQMKANLQPVERTSKEFQLIQTYVANTHAPTHCDYNLSVDEIFKVKREGEKERFRPFKSLHNRQLLWHGSRLTNFAGIITNGLKIAPKEAAATGYMFGKGIYFADMVSKSANYCFATPNNSTGLMLLSEVALGNTLNLTKATNVVQLDNNFHSVRGMGKTIPNPDMVETLKTGVKVPLGTPMTCDDALKTDLLYNEYIVYDVGQVNIKYLIKMKFDFINKKK